MATIANTADRANAATNSIGASEIRKPLSKPSLDTNWPEKSKPGHGYATRAQSKSAVVK